MPLLHDKHGRVHGRDDLDVRRRSASTDVPAPPVLVAALGPQMLELAGTVADGTVTWMTGPATLASHTVPTITAAAERAGRPAPEVFASLPICVTDDAGRGADACAQDFQVYGFLPSYRAMLDREGAETPGDVAIVGDEADGREGSWGNCATPASPSSSRRSSGHARTA